MTFSEFANKLHPIIGGGSRTSTFVETLFKNIISDEGLEIVNGYNDETLKGYYNGNKEISRLAKKIQPYVDPQKFDVYIQTFDDVPTEKLCEAFRSDIVDINKLNAGEKLAELFDSIITDAAHLKRKQVTKKKLHPEAELIKTRPIEDTEVDEVDDNQQQKNIFENENNKCYTLNTKSIASAATMMAVQSFSKEYYQLLVTTEEDVFKNNIVTIQKDRALTQYLVPPEIFDRCSSLSDAGIAELKTFPAIICQENDGYWGEVSPDRKAVYGYIKLVQIRPYEIKVAFEPIATFFQQKLCEEQKAIYFDLTMDCAVTDLNRSGWSVHKANLFAAFDEVGLTGFPRPD